MRAGNTEIVRKALESAVKLYNASDGSALFTAHNFVYAYNCLSPSASRLGSYAEAETLLNARGDVAPYFAHTTVVNPVVNRAYILLGKLEMACQEAADHEG